jgi:outer membrane protein assembly factor BamB
MSLASETVSREGKGGAMGSFLFGRSARWFAIMAIALGATCFAARFQAAQPTGAAPQAAPAAQDDWPQYHYAANQQNFNPKETLLSVHNVNQLVLVWKYTTGGQVFSSPAVAGGILYAGSDNIYALNASTGALLWKYTNGQTFSSPAVFNGMVYAVSSDDYLYALDARTGTLRWKFSIGRNFTWPSVANGAVYVTGSEGGYALSGSTGTVLWNTPGLGSGVAVANGLAYSPGGVGAPSLLGVNAYNGKIVWRTPTLGLSTPAVQNGVAYESSNDLFALEASTGNYLWEYPVYSTIVPTVAGSTVYTVSGYENASIYALKADTGALLWQYPTSSLGALLAAANGVVYVSLDESANALDGATGSLLWTFPVGASGSPVIANGMLYIGSDDDNIYAFGLKSSDAR